MIKRSILILAVLLGCSISAHAACTLVSAGVYKAASASYADVKACIDIAVDDETVIIPTDSPKTWDTTLTITHAITLKGEVPCTYDMYGAPTDCTTTILDNADSAFLISWTCVDGKTHRMTDLKFGDNGFTTGGHNPRIIISCLSTTDTVFNGDHLLFDHLKDFPVYLYDVIGSWDHNTFLQSGQFNPYYIFDPSWKGIARYSDNSWSANVTYGSNDNLFIEDNVITWDAGQQYVCFDGYGGTRVVFRFNHTTGCGISIHGTDTAQRARGGRFFEMYGNLMDANGDLAQPIYQIADIRSGAGMIWGNPMTNMAAGYMNFVASLVTDRTTGRAGPFKTADGRNNVDLNDAGNPFNPGSGCPAGVCTATAGGSLSVTVSGTPFTGLDLTGYVVHKTDNCTSICSGIVSSHTGSTLTFESPYPHDSDISFTGGDHFEFNKVTASLDQPGVGGGTRIINKLCSAFTSSGTTATATCASHGFSTNDWVVMQDDGFPNSGFVGTYQITLDGVDPTNKFHFTCAFTCGTDSVGEANKIPSTNDQTVFPVYQWSNTMAGASRYISIQTTAVPSVRENEHFYDFGGTIQSDATTPFNGTAASHNGVGVGIKSRMPSSCTGKSFYWATDEGSWRTAVPSTGQTIQGLGYQCNGSTFTLAYTPATYPNIYRSGASASITSLTPPSGLQGAINLSVAVVGSNTNFVNATTVCYFGANITVNSCTVSSATALTANITISASAATGARDATFTTGGEVATSTGGFTVNATGSGLSLKLRLKGF